MKLSLHPVTTLLIEGFTRDMPQSLLLHGAAGVGLSTIASEIAGKSKASIVRPQTAKGETGEGIGTIGVEVIRDLYHQTRTKTSEIRTVIIDDADRMSRSAQGAFLKLLEEPNSSTRFILTSHSVNVLLPTIRSRAQQFYIQPVSAEQSKEFIGTLGEHDGTKQNQLLFLASGLPAELSRLIQDPEYFQKRAGVIGDARNLIAADAYQKMRIVWRYRSDRDEALRLIDSAMAILKYTLTTKPQQKLIIQLENLLDARERIASNQNVALQLGKAML